MTASLTLRARLFALSGIAMALLLVLSAMLFHGIRSATEGLRHVYAENVLPLQKLQQIGDQLKEARFRAAGVAMDLLPAAGSRNHLGEVRSALPEAWREYRRMTVLGADEAAERELTERLEKGLETLPPLFAKLDAAYQAADGRRALVEVLEEDWATVIAKVSKPLGELIEMRTREVEAVYAEAVAMESRLNATALTLVIVAVLLLALVTAWIVRAIGRAVADVQRTLASVAQGDLTARAEAAGGDELAAMGRALNDSLGRLCQTLADVRSGADQVAEVSAQVKRSAAENHSRAEAQAEEVMKMSAAMEELTVSVSEISGGSEKVSQAAARAQVAAQNGSGVISESRRATEQAQRDAQRASTAVGELTQSLQKINSIAATIREIADQTNLLALNAAIEAARAGEAGRGFAVVADEVRKLAERTGSSTAEIAGIVRGVETQAATAVTAMGEVDADVARDAENIARLEQSFAAILEAATEVSGLSGEIAHSTKEQKLVAEQTAGAMETISQAVDQTSASLGTMATAADRSAATAETLKGAVARFRVG
jgi:methyl-accepting chemotaxis protein